MMDPFLALRSWMMDPRAFGEKQMDPRSLGICPLACLDFAVAANMSFSVACSLLDFLLASLVSTVAAGMSFSVACCSLTGFALASLVSAAAANLAFSRTCSCDIIWTLDLERLLDGVRQRRTLDLERLRGDVRLVELERPRENVRRRWLLRRLDLELLRTRDLERLLLIRTLDLEPLRTLDLACSWKLDSSLWYKGSSFIAASKSGNSCAFLPFKFFPTNSFTSRSL